MKGVPMLALALLMLAPVATLAGQSSAPPSATAPSYKRDIPPALAARAKITEDTAAARALRRVPGGQVTHLVLEVEGGKLVYSFDITVPGKAGITEVHVSAVTGRVVRVEQEAD
jgi:uncharacterized membrane protein YkoI